MRAFGAFSTMTFKEKMDETAINFMLLSGETSWQEFLLAATFFFFFSFTNKSTASQKKSKIRSLCVVYLYFSFSNVVEKNWLKRERASRCNYHMISSLGVRSPCVRFNCLANEKTFSLFF